MQKKLDEKTIEGYYVDVLKRLGRFQMSGGLDHVFVAPRVGMDAVFPIGERTARIACF